MGYLKVVLVLIVVSTASACDYSQYGSDHTMCEYEANACNAKVRGFSKSQATDAVKFHNEKRQIVASGNQKGQPSASNMKQLVWNDELAEIAQRWADQCEFGHDKNRRSKKFSYVGQNVYMSWGTMSNNLDIKGAINSWYNEVTEPGFNSKDISPFQFSTGTGHYTQVVWANTEAIGCGYSYYTMNNYNYNLIVCNYGPGGNMMSGTMYKTGKPCSSCANGCSAQYNALCK